MGNARIEDLAVGELDPGGQQVRELYAKNAPHYGVYRTAKRVCVQFADDEAAEQRQRAALAPLGMLRSDINGLIDGWRSSDRHRARARRRRFDRGTADGLISALEGNAGRALYELRTVRDTILNARTAIGRFQYLGVAFAVVVATYLLLWLTSFRAITSSAVTTLQIGDVLIAIGGGALGAFLSIAIALKDRTVLPDLQWVANISDAVLRMIVGIVAAAIVICLLRGGFGLTFGTQAPSCAIGQTACDANHGWMQVFGLGVVAGFLEKMVPDLLGKIEATRGASTGDIRAAPPAEEPGASRDGIVPTPPPPGPDDAGDCLCNQPLADADVTADSALPPSSGGVR